MKVGVAGCMGYAGFELVRLLDNHPDVIINALTARNPDSVKSDPRFFFLLKKDNEVRISNFKE